MKIYFTLKLLEHGYFHLQHLLWLFCRLKFQSNSLPTRNILAFIDLTKTSAANFTHLELHTRANDILTINPKQSHKSTNTHSHYFSLNSLLQCTREKGHVGSINSLNMFYQWPTEVYTTCTYMHKYSGNRFEVKVSINRGGCTTSGQNTLLNSE